MKFTKIHGLGNDFVMVNCMERELTNVPELAQRVCERHFGIGADGLILVLPSKVADFRMRIYNIDGSEAEMCGNGIRCFAKYVYENGLTKERVVRVETLAGIIVPELIVEEGKVNQVKVDMGEPRLVPAVIPVNLDGESVINRKVTLDGNKYAITCVSMGNPHCIIFVDKVASINLAKVGSGIEHDPLFPRKTNVEFVEKINDHELIMRVWERGCGMTLACGTGTCATAVAAVLNGLTGRKVTVHLPGGDLIAEWADNNHVYMTGPACEVFHGEYLL